MDRRARYLDAALDLFIAHGFHGVSMDQLVAVTGGSKATLYRYFESKEALFEAIIDDVAARTVGVADPDDWGAVPLEDGLRQLGLAVAAGAMSDRTIALLRLAAGELARFPQLGELLFQHGPEVSYARLRRFLSAKRDQGVIAVADLQIAAEQFLGGIIGHQQLRAMLGVERADAAGMDARIEAAVASFVATYAVPRAAAT